MTTITPPLQSVLHAQEPSLSRPSSMRNTTAMGCFTTQPAMLMQVEHEFKISGQRKNATRSGGLVADALLSDRRETGDGLRL